jgi:hypothetical protein
MSVVVNEKNVTDEVIALIARSVAANPAVAAQRNEAFETFNKQILPETKT